MLVSLLSFVIRLVNRFSPRCAVTNSVVHLPMVIITSLMITAGVIIIICITVCCRWSVTSVPQMWQIWHRSTDDFGILLYPIPCAVWVPVRLVILTERAVTLIFRSKLPNSTHNALPILPVTVKRWKSTGLRLAIPVVATMGIATVHSSAFAHSLIDGHPQTNNLKESIIIHTPHLMMGKKNHIPLFSVPRSLSLVSL